jgi:hypothetical protein
VETGEPTGRVPAQSPLVPVKRKTLSTVRFHASLVVDFTPGARLGWSSVPKRFRLGARREFSAWRPPTCTRESRHAGEDKPPTPWDDAAVLRTETRPESGRGR